MDVLSVSSQGYAPDSLELGSFEARRMPIGMSCIFISRLRYYQTSLLMVVFSYLDLSEKWNPSRTNSPYYNSVWKLSTSLSSRNIKSLLR